MVDSHEKRLERGLARKHGQMPYRSDLHQFGAFLAHRNRDALAVEHAELAAFLDTLANSPTGRPPLAAATLQRKIACLGGHDNSLAASDDCGAIPTVSSPQIPLCGVFTG